MKPLVALIVSAFMSWGSALEVCGAARDDLYPGRDGWLFQFDDVHDYYGTDNVRPYVERLGQAFERVGVQLVAVPLPRRASVSAEKLDPFAPEFTDYSVEAAYEGYQNILDVFSGAGIIAPDLVGAAGRSRTPFFLERDIHWSPAGAELAARSVKSAIADHPAYSSLEKTAFVNVPTDALPFAGSMETVLEESCSVQIAEQPVQQYVTERADTQQAGLFDEVAPPSVVLVGDSNSLRPEGQPQFNFAGFLQEYLSLEVLNASVNGGGAFTALQTFLVSPEYRQRKPAWLVWEFRAWPIAVASIAEYRATIPAVYGGCREALVSSRMNLEGTNVTLLDATGVGAQGSDYYLNLNFSDLSVVEFTVSLEHADGQEEVALSRSTRAPNTGEFFLELSDNLLSPLQSASLTLPTTTNGTVDVRLCHIG